jgi:hypothetical protein
MNKKLNFILLLVALMVIVPVQGDASQEVLAVNILFSQYEVEVREVYRTQTAATSEPGIIDFYIRLYDEQRQLVKEQGIKQPQLQGAPDEDWFNEEGEQVTYPGDNPGEVQETYFIATQEEVRYIAVFDKSGNQETLVDLDDSRFEEENISRPEVRTIQNSSMQESNASELSKGLQDDGSQEGFPWLFTLGFILVIGVAGALVWILRKK